MEKWRGQRGRVPGELGKSRKYQKGSTDKREERKEKWQEGKETEVKWRVLVENTEAHKHSLTRKLRPCPCTGSGPSLPICMCRYLNTCTQHQSHAHICFPCKRREWAWDFEKSSSLWACPLNSPNISHFPKLVWMHCWPILLLYAQQESWLLYIPC